MRLALNIFNFSFHIYFLGLAGIINFPSLGVCDIVRRMPNQTQAMSLLTSHESVQWYTPEPYIKLVRQVLGEIDLDPASNSFANGWIRAKKFYSESNDGLAHPWNGRVFLNPPYGKSEGASNQALWSQAMIQSYAHDEMTEGILLVNSTHGYKWYEELYNRYPSCLVYERIRFLNAHGIAGGQAKRGQTFIYFGENEERFVEVFKVIGRCLPANSDYHK